MLSYRTLRTALLPLCAGLVLCTTALIARAADTPQAGERVQIDYISGWKFARVKEVGTGDHGGQYLLVFEEGGSEYWWTDYKLPTKIFLVDTDGKRVKDFHARPGDPSPLDPGALSKDFKVGDRVEVVNASGVWEPGTVTGPLEYNRYLVVLDKWKGKGLPDTHAQPPDLRAPLTATKAPDIPKVAPMRPPISAPDQAGQAGPPPTALAKKLIQAVWEEQSYPGNTINFDIHSLQIGSPRRWIVNRDIGPGNQTTVIYPVLVRSTKRTYSSTHVVISDEEGTYKVYVDLFGKWHAGYESSKALKPLQDIYFK